MIRSILLALARTQIVEQGYIVRRVVCQVQEQCDSFHTPILLEVSCEKSTCFHIDTHSRENNGEVLLMTIMDILRRLIDQPGLTTYLRSNFVVR